MSPEIIRQIRKTAGLSQRAFAESIGVCQSTVGNYETKGRKISEAIWSKITAVYHDVFERLGISEEMQEEPGKNLALSPEAAAIRQIRVASGFTQKEFADSLGFSKSVIGNCEAGLSKVSDRLWTKVMEKYSDQSFGNKAESCGEMMIDHDDECDHVNEITEKGETSIIIQSPFGSEITVDELVARVGDVDKVYVRADHNAAYWVRGKETGKVELWP